MIEALITSMACILMLLGGIMADSTEMLTVIIGIYLIGITQGIIIHG